MAVRGTRVTVTDAAAKLVAASGGNQTGSGGTLRNLSSTVDVDLGGSAVATGAGFPLKAGESLPYELEAGESIYAVAASAATASVAVLEGGV